MPAHRTPRWTAAEIAVLRDRYPAGGAEAVRAHLPARSWRAIYAHAHKLGIRRPPAATNATAPEPKLAGADLEEAIRRREEEGWSFARIGERFGVSEASACNGVLIALCPRKGFVPAQRDDKGRLTDEGLERVRLALRKGLKGCDIQLRLGVSAGCVSEQRRRYNRELKERRKMPLPPPGGGEAYSGVRVPRAKRAEVEALFMEGLGSTTIHARTGVSHTTIGRIRRRLIKRLKRQGRTLPGCDARGVRHAQAASSRFVQPEQIAAFRELLLDRVPVRRAAEHCVIGLCSAYRLRDAFEAERRTAGQTLPAPRLPGRIKGGGYPVDPVWPPRGAADIYRFRALLRDQPFDAAKAAWRRQKREALEAERARPKAFEEQLARIARGEIGVAPAIARRHLDTTVLRREEQPPVGP